jgi:hypothetical protein
MSNKNLFKEAIADAKAVREAALANAKAALEEALTPRLQSMLSAKLNEMEDGDDYLPPPPEETHKIIEDEEMEEGFESSHSENSDANLDFNLEEEEDFDLSEILAELNEAEEKEKKKEKKEDEEDEENEMPEDIESLKALIQDLISQEMGNEGGAEMHAEPDADNMGGPSDQDADNADEEIDLEELLAELDEMGNDGEDLEEIDFKKIGSSIKKGVTRFAQNYLSQNPKDCKERGLKFGKEGSTEWWDEVNKCRKEKGLDPLVSSSGAGLSGTSSGGFGEAQEINEYMAGQESLIDLGNWAIENFPTVAKQLGQDAVQIGGAVTGLATVGGIALTGALGTLISKAKAYIKSKKSSSSDKDKGEMSEAIRTIKTLRNELNEVNLLNAKLLYVNKIFKAKNLTESQKLKVIASFDKATTAKEAKVVFESLNTTLRATPKQAIKESYGFASRAAGVAPRKAIVESNDVIARMQKLANIIK